VTANSGLTVRVALSPRDYDAVLFDLDGVLTRTAAVHAVAWKQLFDTFLAERAAAAGEPFVPFDLDIDYRRHVDGKPRLDGIRDFLASRSVVLSEPEIEALGKRKDGYFLEALKKQGVEVYPSASLPLCHGYMAPRYPAARAAARASSRRR
jgi:beta-phosphoglucomutase-like phosphatase (HAD superfamily)